MSKDKSSYMVYIEHFTHTNNAMKLLRNPNIGEKGLGGEEERHMGFKSNQNLLRKPDSKLEISKVNMAHKEMAFLN